MFWGYIDGNQWYDNINYFVFLNSPNSSIKMFLKLSSSTYIRIDTYTGWSK